MKPRMTALNRAWTIVIIAGTTAVAVFIPLGLVFARGVVTAVVLIEGIVTALFIADVVINLVRVRREEESGRRWMIVADVIAVIPFGLFGGPVFLPLLRLVKLVRVGGYMVDWLHHRVSRWNVLLLVYFIYWVFLSVHWLVCGWIGLRGIPTGWDDGTVYLRSLYWCITTITTMGYGEITPANNAQILYAMVVMVYGIAIYGYVIGNVANFLANINPARSRYLESMQKLTTFMHYRRLPETLQRHIRDYYAYVWEQRLGYDESSILEGLSPDLFTEVSLFLKRDIIQKVPFFKDANENLLREIALRMRPVVYTPGSYVFREGEPGHEMYFVSRGNLEVVSRDGVHAVLVDGDIFGEIALLRQQPRNASIRAVSYCDLYTLDKESFKRILATFPEFAAHIEAMTKERQGDR